MKLREHRRIGSVRASPRLGVGNSVQMTLGPDGLSIGNPVAPVDKTR
jgi:hypothetical protein